MSGPAKRAMASLESQNERVRNSARPPAPRQRIHAPWLPGVSRYALTPVSSRYRTYSPASSSAVAPRQIRAIIFDARTSDFAHLRLNYDGKDQSVKRGVGRRGVSVDAVDEPGAKAPAPGD